MPGEDKFVFAPRFVDQTFEMAMYRVQDLEINTTYDEVQETVAAKEAQFEAASAAAQAIAADISSKSAAAAAKQSEISAIALSVPVAASNLAIALGKLEALEVEAASLNVQLAEVTAALATNASSVAAKQAQISVLAAQPGNNTAAMNVLVAELAVLTLRRSDLQAVSADLVLEVAAKSAEVQAQLNTITIQSAQAGYDPVKMAELVVQTTTLEELKEERAALASDLAVVNQQLASNAAAIRSKQASIGILTAKPGDNSAAIAMLQGELAALQAIKTDLQAEASRLTTSLAAKDAVVATQQAAVNALATQAGTNSASIALMTVKIVVRDSLTSEVSVLQDSKLAFDDQTAQLATVVAVSAVPPTEVEWDTEPGTLAAAARLSAINHDLSDATVADRYAIVSGDIPPGTTFSTEGLLSGTVMTAGDYTFTVRAGTNFPTQFSDKVFSLHVAPEVLWQTATLSNLELQGADQTRAFVAINAVYFEVLTGSLPTGTTLSAGGMLSGTPTAHGTSTFTVRATSDHPDIYVDRAFTLQVVATPVWSTPAALTDVAKSEGYSVQLVAPTIDGTTTFVVQSGTLPAGLTLSTAGLLAGTPSSAGTVAWTVRATGINAFADRTFTQLIANRPAWSTSAALANTAQSVAYTTTLSATNGFSPGFAVVSGFVPTGTALSDGGVLSGTPTALGTYTFTVRSTSATSAIIYADRTFTQTTVPLPVWVTAGGAYADVPQGAAVTSVQLSATNALTFTVSSGSLPTGLSLSATGLLSGTPTVSGSYSWTVRATGSATNATADRSFSMLVATVPTWTTAAALANTSASVAYSTTLSATNALASGYSVISGSLPTGASLSSTGVLSGTPSATGSYSFTIRAMSTTSSIVYADRAFTQTVVALPVWSTPEAGALTDVASAAAYSIQFTATNAVSYAVQSGTLPTGLTLSGGGLLSGTPSAAGSFSFTIRATGNAANSTADRSWTQLVATAPSWVTSASIANTSQAVLYSTTLTATNANPTGFSVLSGSLPTGTSLTSAGVLSGTPTVLGTYSFTVRVLSTTSAVIFVDRAFTQTVVALPVWSSPAAGAFTDFAAGSAYSQQFTASNTVSYSVQTGEIPSGLSLSAGGLLNGTPSAGAYSFTIRATGNATNATADRSFTQLVATAPSWNTGGTLANTAQNVSYSFQLSASNGNAYSVVGGTLPSGVSLSGSGLLSGTPSATGSNSFTVRVTSTTSASIYADRAFSLTVVAVPVWSTSATLTSVVEDVAYSVQLSASPVVSYSLKSGSAFPTGVTMNGSGLLSGAPTTPASYTFTITANGDAANAATDRTFTLVVTAAAAAGGTFTAIRYLSFNPLSVNGGGTQVQMTQASFNNASGTVVTASMSLVGAGVYIQGTGFTTNQQCFDSLQNFSSITHCNFGPIPTSMIVYDFGSSATCSTVKSFYLGGSDDSNRFPNNIQIQGSASSDMSNAVTLYNAAPQTGFGFNNTGLKAADIAIPTESWEYKVYDMRSWAVDRSIWAANVNDGNRTFYSFNVPNANTIRVTDDFIAFSIVGQSGTAWQKYYYDGVGFNISGTNFNVSITEASGGALSANGVSYTGGQATVTTGVAASNSTWSSVLKVTVTTTSVDAAMYYTADGTVNTDALGSLVLRYVWTLSSPFTVAALKGKLTSFNSRMYNGYDPARMLTNFYDYTGKHYRSSNWETRVASAGGSASPSIKSAVDSLVKKLDSTGVLYKMRRLNAFVGDQWTAALVPILNTIGSTTDAPGNMSSSDYTVLTGFKGNGSNKYINTGFNLNSVSGNGTNMHMALMALTSANGRLMGVARGDVFTRHYMFDGGFSWGNGGSRTPGALGGEHMIATRSGSGPAYFYSVGKQTGSHPTPDGSQPPDLAVTILAHNQSPSGGSDGNINSFSSSNVGGYSMGFNITAENAAAYSAAMADFNDSMGRNVNRIAGGATLLPSGTTVTAVVPSLNGFHTPYMLFNNGIKHVDSTNTHYHTVSGYTSDTITMTFSTSYKVAYMRMWRRDGDDFYATNMRVEGGPVGGPYTTVYETSGVIPPAHGLNSSQWDSYETQGYGEYIIHSTKAYPVYRFVFTYSQGYLSLGEMMLYGTPAIVNDETKSWKARVTANGGTVNASVVAAVDVFVSALKTAGILTKMSRLNLFCGNQMAAALVPIVNTSGSPTDLSTGFGASDYSQSGGFQGGTGKYIDTGLGMSSLSPNGLDLHLSVATLTAASGFMLGYVESTEYCVNDNNYGYGWGGWYARSPVSQGAEHIVATRSTSGPSYFYSNAVQTGSQASPSGIATSGQTMTVLAGRYDNNGTVGGYTNAKVSTYSVGKYLSASEVTAYRNAVATFNTAMGR
jgi:hypothetical protein